MKRIALLLTISVSIFSFGQSIRLVKEFNPSGNSNPTNYLVNGNKMYFIANNGSESRLYVTDGTTAGTRSVLDETTSLQATYEPMAVLNGMVAFVGVSTNGRELCFTDGTDAGTVYFDLLPGAASSEPRQLYVFNNKLYFSADDGTHGRELWVSDGTVGGTHMLKDINATGSSEPQEFCAYNGKLYFQAWGSNAIGRELYRTDGTAAGTELFDDLDNGAGSTGPQYLHVFQNKLFFFSAFGVWVSDGTVANTINLKSAMMMNNYAYGDDYLYFVCTDPLYDEEIFRTDGTVAGTKLVADINSGSTSKYPKELTLFNHKIFFKVGTPAYGQELWSTNGTSAGTQIFKDIITGATGAVGGNLEACGSRLYFYANDGVNNTQLWFTDGSLASTQALMASFATTSNPTFDQFGATCFNNEYYFGASYDDKGVELYKVGFPDGINEEAQPNWICFPNPMADRLFFKNVKYGETIAITDVSGNAVWRGALDADASADIHALASGLYFVQIGNRTAKLIKE
ncbi:MAG: ELWxxDGT repeat protein [Chitinophagales bacterium]